MPDDRPPDPRRSSRLAVLAGAVGVGLLVLALVAWTTGDDDAPPTDTTLVDTAPTVLGTELERTTTTTSTVPPPATSDTAPPATAPPVVTQPPATTPPPPPPTTAPPVTLIPPVTITAPSRTTTTDPG